MTPVFPRMLSLLIHLCVGFYVFFFTYAMVIKMSRLSRLDEFVSPSACLRRRDATGCFEQAAGKNMLTLRIFVFIARWKN